MNDIKDTPLPIGKRVLVYVVNSVEPGWYIDFFHASGPSDHHQLNGSYYAHNITHWAELPEDPK